MYTTMSYNHSPLKTPLDGRRWHEILEYTTEKHPDKDAMIAYDMDLNRNSMTYAEFRDRSRCLAGSLLELGLSRGQRVLLVGRTTLQYAVFIMAFKRLGVNTILLGQGMLSPEKVELLKTLNLRMIAFDPEMNDSQRSQLMAGIKGLVLYTAQPQIVVTLQDHVHIEIKDAILHDYDDLIRYGQTLNLHKLQEAESNIQLDDPVLTLFTSGSSGQPKLVTYTVHGSVNVHGGKPLSTPDMPLDKHAMDRPLSWSVGYALAYVPMIREGVTFVHIPPDLSTSNTTVEAVFKIWQDEKCCSSYVGAALLAKLATDTVHLNYDLHRMKVFFLAGQRYSLSSIQNLFDCCPSAEVKLYYGSTETNGMCSETFKKDRVDERLSIVPGVEIKIIDGSGRLVPRGAIGEICVRSSTMFLEYLDNPMATSQAKSPTGSFHTTDKGTMDDMGRVEILGRDIELIKRASANVVPAEVEFVIRKHPSVVDVVVVGVPDEVLGEEICACVILDNNENTSSKIKVGELDEWCKAHWPIGPDGLTLAPKYILPMKTFPLARVSGKILTRQINDDAIKRLQTEGHLQKSN